MTYDKGQLSDVPDTSQNVLVIASEKELMNFLMDILEIGNGIESEETLQKIKSYRILFSFLSRISVLTIVIEDKYVDRIYRDSFYMHFSCKHGDYSRFCKRLFLFWGDVFEDTEKQMFSELDANDLQKRFIGTVVIRPLIEGKVGRSLINPYFILGKADTYLRYAKYSATIYGIRLRISAFPFSMTDGETTNCAELTILN
ncbi:MAG: hypothetical protein K2G55_07030, partial [Lachnospiraceae bacterium]|nr:hypothetical protein [Lachnospiraceae bacterium]